MSKDLTRKLNGSLEDKVDRLIVAVQSMDSRLANVEKRFASVETRLVAVETRLEKLETKVDERLKETRPMWEAVQAQLTEIRESQERLRYETEKGFRVIDRRLERQPIEMERLHGFQRDLEERVEKVEQRLGEYCARFTSTAPSNASTLRLLVLS